MKQISLITILVLFFIKLSFSQNEKFNFIISVDDEIIKTLYNPQIMTNEVTIKDILYFPGELSIDENSYKKVVENNGDIYLMFDYYKYSKRGKQTIFNYKVKIGANWFSQSYLILKIKNSCKKKNGKYTFSIDYPGGSSIQVK